MSIILKHQIDFPEARITVSNDLFLATLILNAEVKATILRGGFGSEFEITFDEMPMSSAQKLADTKRSGLTVVIKLGYFDTFSIVPKTVMEGVVTKVEAKAEDGKLKTKVTGFEKTTHALREVKADEIGYDLGGETDVLLSEVLSGLLGIDALSGAAGSSATFTPVTLAFSLRLENPSFRGDTLLDVLDDLVSRATGGNGRPQMFVYDGVLTVGVPLTSLKPPLVLDPGLNLAEFAPFEKKVDKPEGTNRVEPLPAEDVNGFNFTIVGEPELRPMQVVAPLVQDYSANGVFRVHSVVHEYGKSGYRCRGRAVQGAFDREPADSRTASAVPSGRQLVTGLTERIKAQASRPQIETGLVKDLTADQPQRADTYYHQRFETGTAQPSLTADVDRDSRRLAANVPLVSPFAWHKCGLAMPVYPGMKVLLAHNLGLPGDVLSLGALWSETPAYEPPPAEPGDWWLCLPVNPQGTGADGLGPPADSTKATNDLTGKSGERVIEAKSLTIRIGGSALGNIGARPALGAADTFVIEHKSGTTITIDANGKVTIDATEVEVTGNLTVGGDARITGNLEVE